MRLPALSCLLALATALPAAADLTLTATSGGTGLAGLAEGTTTTRFQGSRMRSDLEAGERSFSTIFDLDAQQMIALNHRKKTAETVSFAEMNEILQSVDEGSIRATLTPAGGSRTIAGLDCREHRFEVFVPSAGVAGGPTVDLTMEGTVWLAPEAPGVEDYRAFYLAAAEKGIVFTDPDAAKAQPGQARGMAALHREMARAGVPCETSIAMRFSGEGPLAAIMSRMDMTMTSATQSVSTDALAADLFAIPAGYKVKGR